MFLPSLPILTLTLLCFFFFHHSFFIFTAGNFPTPYSPVDNIAVDNNHFLDNNRANPNTVFPSPTPKLRKLGFAFGRGNTIATGVIIVITLLNIIVYKLRQLQEVHSGEELGVLASLSSGQVCRRFSLAKIQLATRNFDDELVIGRGGFGKVYKGLIDNGTTTVAIKRLNPTSRQGAPEFWTEIEMLSKFRHSNLVSLIGYCENYVEMILVYEYMLRGTIADHLHTISRSDNSPLSWVQRLKICIDAARGLDYLHTGTGVQQRVIHRDVKSSNILLDENWVAKISDFGMSKIGPANQACTHVSTNIKGTIGYVDPEYLLTRRLTRKSDVYAYGVVLFEVLCGRPAVDLRLHEEQRGLARWAQQCIREGTLDQIIDPSLRGQTLSNSLMEFSQIADQCLHNRPKKRPTMAEVMARLELALALQERTDSSILGEDIFNRAYDNTEDVIFSTEQQQVVNASNGEHRNEQIDDTITSVDASHEQSHRRPANISTIMRKVRLLFSAPARVSSGSQVFNGNRSVESLRFDFGTIRVATNNFSSHNRLGQGGFGIVYKGRLRNGEEIAVKWISSVTHVEEQFINEVRLLAELRHRNLVKLIGFCLEGTERVLIYEFMPHSSLDHFLFEPKEPTYLDWDMRYNIIRGVARGLLYLHEDSRLQIIHRDLKASNILLDKEMNPKISDFSQAKLIALDETQDTRRIVGTFGYIAPEYITHGQVSIKSDVFSFGVLILEIISGQKNNRLNAENLISYAWSNWWKGTPLSMTDPTLRVSSNSPQDIMRCIHIGLLCVQEKVSDRPTMGSVVLMLNSSSFTLPDPSEPAFFMHSSIYMGRTQLGEYNSRANEFDQLDNISFIESVNEDSSTEIYPR